MSTNESLEARVNRLERKLRQFRIGAALVLLLGGSAAVLGMSSPPGVLEVRGIKITRGNGSEAAFFGIENLPRKDGTIDVAAILRLTEASGDAKPLETSIRAGDVKVASTRDGIVRSSALVASCCLSS